VTDSAVVALKGDNTDLQTKLDASIATLQGWGSKVSSVGKAVAGVFVAKKLFGFVGDLVSSAMEAEDNARQLDKTIANLGDKAKMSAADVKGFASELQNFTKFEDDAAIKAQTLFLRLGTLDEKGIKRATVAAADLATVMGTDLEAASSKIMMALKDPENGIRQLRQAGIKFTEAEEQMIKSLVKAGDEAAAQEIIMGKLEAAIGGSAKAAGETASGQMEIFKNRLADVGETIGGALMGAFTALTPMLDAFAGWMENVGGPAITSIIETMVSWGKVIGEYVSPVLKFFADGAILTFTAVQTIVQNFGKVAELTLRSYVLAIVATAGEVKHFLTEVIPAYVGWFGRNWKEVFYDAGQVVITVTKNMWTNLVNFWDSIKGLFSGDGFNFEMTPLLEGFQSTAEELPKIRDRVKGELEKGLEIRVGELKGELAGAFEKNLAANRKAIFGDATEKEAPKELDVSGTKNPMLDAALAAGAAAMVGEEKKKDTKSESEKKETAQADARGGAFEDLMSLNKRIAGAAAQTIDPTTKAVEKQTDETKKVVGEQKTTNNLLTQVVDGVANFAKLLPSVGGLTD